MNILLIVGRIAFVIIFILSGAQKLTDIGGTAAMIAPRLVVPPALAGIAAQLESVSGMALPNLLAIAAGAVELAAGLMIAANIGTRIAAVLLLAFTAAATFWFHDFWNLAGPDRLNNMIHAMKNLSIMGALLVFVVVGPWAPGYSSSGPEQRL
ncbi:MAG: DoxX family protein [Pseudorhodoplanes sp.]|nr:MAG: DoxX family protein [Pseudorhodoplanes sp.]